MRLSGSVYRRPTPVPKMPPGLVELMEGLTKEVLKYNPADVYEFCANHMQKLLEIRDGSSRLKAISLDQRIKMAQEIIRKRSEQRLRNKDCKNLTPVEKAVPPMVIKHHDNDLANALEIEISCHSGDMAGIHENSKETEMDKEVEKIPQLSDEQKQEDSGVITTLEEVKLDKDGDKLNNNNVKESAISNNLIPVTNHNKIETTKSEETKVFEVTLSNNDINSSRNLENIEQTLENELNQKVTESSKVDTRDSIIDEKGDRKDKGKDTHKEGYCETNNTNTNSINKSNLMIDGKNNSGVEIYVTESEQLSEEIGDALPLDSNEAVQKKEEQYLTNSLSTIANETISLENDQIAANTLLKSNDDILMLSFHTTENQEKNMIAHNSIEDESNETLNLKNSIFNVQDNFSEPKTVGQSISNNQKIYPVDLVSDIENKIQDQNTSSFAEIVHKSENHKNKETAQNTVNIDINAENNQDIAKNIIFLSINEQAQNLSPEIKKSISDNSEEAHLGSDMFNDGGAAQSPVVDQVATEVSKDPMYVYERQIPEVDVSKCSGENSSQNSKILSNDFHTEMITDIKQDYIDTSDLKTLQDNGTEKCNQIPPTINDHTIVESDSASNTIAVKADTTNCSDEIIQNDSSNTMDLETAAVTIQKVFRAFLFKSRASTFDESANDDANLSDGENDDDNKEARPYLPPTLNKDRRTLGIRRMDTVLQTVNEEKSLSLSTDDSSTLSSAATIIQAHVRGFLVRNKLHSGKTASSSNSLINSNGPSITSLEGDGDQHKNKTILNIHIVPEGNNLLSRDESMITSIDLSLDGSPPTSLNLHPLGYDKSERRKQLKREDAIQSVSPPSNNSGKLSDDIESVKELPSNVSLEQETVSAILSKGDVNLDSKIDSDDTTHTNSIKVETVLDDLESNTEIISSSEPAQEKLDNTIKKLTKQSSDEMDVVTPFIENPTRASETSSRLLHSGEFHDILLPTKVTRSDTPVVSGE